MYYKLHNIDIVTALSCISLIFLDCLPFKNNFPQIELFLLKCSEMARENFKKYKNEPEEGYNLADIKNGIKQSFGRPNPDERKRKRNEKKIEISSESSDSSESPDSSVGNI
jgi:hypothetical protein